MASDKLMNHTQGETIIDKLTSIADSLDDISAISPAKLGLGMGVCDTAASTAAKTVAIANYTITEGSPVSVQFLYANTAANATLNINNTGAKPILYKDNPLGNNVISAGDTCTFIYTTNSYRIINIDTLTGAGTGTVTQIGAENGLITDQTNNADIHHDGKIGLNLKSTTAFSSEVSAHNTSTDNMYPVALDSEGHPVAAISNFVGSGSNHKAGLVPDTPSTAGTTKYLREDATWVEPTGDNLKLTGYEIESQAAAVAATDTINEGIGKLEYKVDANSSDIQSILDGTTIDSFGDVETALSGKQATLSTAQLAAVNSGIDSTKVGQIATNQSNISSLQDAVNTKLDKTANAVSAAKLNNGTTDYSVGSATKGVYFNNGVPIAMTYSVNSNVPENAVFTDTTYSSGTGITVNASNAINHSNSVTEQTTASALKVAYDAQGHITGSSALTASDVSAIATTAKGAANGVAELDANGKVPSSQLPSYVDDVLEYSAKSAFPATGESGKIYVDTTTNKTYRWSGTTYVEISESLALGDTASTAYYGNKGKVAYEHSQVTSGNPHNVTAAEVGLGNVGNFLAVSTVASQGLSDQEKINARANIGAGTSSLTLGTSATQAAAGNHTHDVSITAAASGSSANVNLSANTIYTLTAGGKTYNFKTPADNNSNTIACAYCDTAAGTAAKTASCSGYALLDKSYLIVTITNTNSSASALTLNINGKGAKSIYINGSASSSSNYTLPAGTYIVYYSTNYYFRTDGKVTTAGMVDIGGNTTKYFRGDGTLADPPGTYSLPTASGSQLGGVKIGSNISNSSGTISLSSTNVTNALGYTPLSSHQTIKQDGVTGATVNRFGICSTSDATAAKTVSITTGTFTLEAGARVTVKFMKINIANSPTLDVNSTGAKNIFHKGAQITTGTNKSLLAGTVDFIYDGTQYHLIGNYIDSHRRIQVNGTEILGNNTTALNLVEGTNVDLITSGGMVTISATDTTYSPATSSTPGLMSAADKAYLTQLVDNSFKNVLRYTFEGWESVNGITVTRNTNGTITANGTAGSGNSYILLSRYLTLPAGTYIISAVNASSADCLIYDDGDWQSVSGKQERTLDGSTTINIFLRVSAGVTLSNVVIKPMICRKEAWNISTAFVPYRSDYNSIGKFIDGIDISGTDAVYNADLNSIDQTITRIYYEPSNAPYALYGFMLVKTLYDDANTTFQEVLAVNNQTDTIFDSVRPRFIRTKTSGSWDPWIEMSENNRFLIDSGGYETSSKTFNTTYLKYQRMYLISIARFYSPTSGSGVAMYAFNNQSSIPLVTTITEFSDCKATISVSNGILTINYSASGYYITSISLL